MTSRARRLGGGSGARVRMSPRARAILAARHAGLPARKPRGHLGQTVLSFAVVMAVILGGAGGAVGLVGASLVTALSAGLPSPTDLDNLTFHQPTVVYDRTGKVELARFELENRRVIR